MRTGILAAGMVAILAATPALARDRMGFQAINAGDLTAAEQTLVAERRIYPQRPELMVNLAAVYDRTGRTAEARALYQAVLAAEEVELALPNGAAASSHLLASTGLARLGQAMAAR